MSPAKTMSPRNVRKSSSPWRNELLRSSSVMLRTGTRVALRDVPRAIVSVAMTPPSIGAVRRKGRRAPAIRHTTVAAKPSEVHVPQRDAFVAVVLRAGEARTGREQRRGARRELGPGTEHRHRNRSDPVNRQLENGA